jgi:hypothetical protein
MRNLLAFSAALAITVSGMGWYMGWYKVHSTPTGEGHHQVTIDIDGGKLTQDAGRVGQSVLKKTEKELDKVLEKQVDNAATSATTTTSPVSNAQ